MTCITLYFPQPHSQIIPKYELEFRTKINIFAKNVHLRLAKGKVRLWKNYADQEFSSPHHDRSLRTK